MWHPKKPNVARCWRVDVGWFFLFSHRIIQSLNSINNNKVVKPRKLIRITRVLSGFTAKIRRGRVTRRAELTACNYSSTQKKRYLPMVKSSFHRWKHVWPKNAKNPHLVSVYCHRVPIKWTGLMISDNPRQMFDLFVLLPPPSWHALLHNKGPSSPFPGHKDFDV